MNSAKKRGNFCVAGVIHDLLEVQASLRQKQIWRFPKIRGTLLGVLIIRVTVYWGLYWGPIILGNYHIDVEA